jgi:NADH dehydrogenase
LVELEMKIAVTGAFSYSGKYITRRLLARGMEVVTLTGHPRRPDPFNGAVKSFPLDFGRPADLWAALAGCDVLVNTYWIRFDRGANTQAKAVQDTQRLIAAASAAHVKRIVHISITNPSLQSPLSYFEGKARNEEAVRGAGASYAILRPTVLFGREDILINNIAFLLRHFPVFPVAGDGSYRVQPVFVDDLAALVEEAVLNSESYTVDAVGPETYSFRGLVAMIGKVVGRQRPLVSVPPFVSRTLARALGALMRDVLLTDQELDGLMANLLVSAEPARCPTRISSWLQDNAGTLGVSYASELKRHFV